MLYVGISKRKNNGLSEACRPNLLNLTRMIKKTIINANTSLLRFLFIAAMVLVSKLAFAGSDLYGKWVGSTDKKLELYVVDDSSEKYDPYMRLHRIYLALDI